MQNKEKKQKKTKDEDNRIHDYSDYCVPYVPVDTTPCDVVVCDCPCDCGC